MFKNNIPIPIVVKHVKYNRLKQNKKLIDKKKLQ